MSATYQFGANPAIDYPRMLIADTDVANPIFQDSEILSAYVIDNVFVIVPAGSPTVNSAVGTPSYRRAAATLLDMLAANKSKLLGALQVLDIKLEFGLASKELREQAKGLREVEANSGNFAIVEMVPNTFAARERVWKQLLRQDN